MQVSSASNGLNYDENLAFLASIVSGFKEDLSSAFEWYGEEDFHMVLATPRYGLTMVFSRVKGDFQLSELGQGQLGEERSQVVLFRTAKSLPDRHVYTDSVNYRRLKKKIVVRKYCIHLCLRQFRVMTMFHTVHVVLSFTVVSRQRKNKGT